MNTQLLKGVLKKTAVLKTDQNSFKNSSVKKYCEKVCY